MPSKKSKLHASRREQNLESSSNKQDDSISRESHSEIRNAQTLINEESSQLSEEFSSDSNSTFNESSESVDSIQHMPELTPQLRKAFANPDTRVELPFHRMETIPSESESKSDSDVESTTQQESTPCEPQPMTSSSAESKTETRKTPVSPNKTPTQRDIHPIAKWMLGTSQRRPHRANSLPQIDTVKSRSYDSKSISSTQTDSEAPTTSRSASSGSSTYQTGRRDSTVVASSSNASKHSSRRNSNDSTKSVRFEGQDSDLIKGKSILKPLKSPFEILLRELKLERVFYDPELDVLNRFCLEFEELARVTLGSRWSLTRSEPPHLRIFKYMVAATEDQGTPSVTSPPPVARPVIHFGLFLDHFRASSSRILDPKVPLPHFTHGHRLNEHRFHKIVSGVFARRLFLGSAVGVSSVKLSDIS